MKENEGSMKITSMSKDVNSLLNQKIKTLNERSSITLGPNNATCGKLNS